MGNSLRAMFILATYNSGVYQLLLILHILSVVIAFAPAVVHPLVGGRFKGDDVPARRFAEAAVLNSRAVHLPALAAVGVLGFALVGVSDKAFRFSDTWVAISIVLWLAIAGIISAVVVPAERAFAAGDTEAEKKVQAGGMIATLLFVIVVCMMVVKPG